MLWHGKPLPPELQAACEHLPPRIVEALEKCGLLAKKQTPLDRPLSELVNEFEQAMKARGRNDLHIAQTIDCIKEILTTREFERWADIDRDQVDAFLRDLREGPRHLSYRRSNAYLIACKSFCNWIVNDREWAMVVEVIEQLQQERDTAGSVLPAEELRAHHWSPAGRGGRC